MEKLDLELLEKIAQLHSVPEGSFNIRKNGERLAANSTDEIQIVQKTDKPGIDIIVAAGVKNKSVHIPVILTVGDFQDTVYNDFFIGEDAAAASTTPAKARRNTTACTPSTSAKTPA